MAVAVAAFNMTLPDAMNQMRRAFLKAEVSELARKRQEAEQYIERLDKIIKRHEEELEALEAGE